MPLLGKALGGIICNLSSAAVADVTIINAVYDSGDGSTFTLVEFDWSTANTNPSGNAGSWNGLQVSNDSGTNWHEPTAVSSSSPPYIILRYAVALNDGDFW